MAEWHAVMEVAWGPEGVFREIVYVELASLSGLAEAVRRAVEEVENWIPDGYKVIGVEKILLYRSKSELCEEHAELEECDDLHDS